MVLDEIKRKYGSLCILVGDGGTGIAVFTAGSAGTDPDMTAALVYGLEQAMREHSTSARDVFFGGLSPQGGLSWCVRKVDIRGESRELYVGVILSPGEMYTYDVNILNQDDEKRGWFFRFLRESLLSEVADAVGGAAEEGFDKFLSSGRKLGASKEVKLLRGVDELGETYKILSRAYKKFQEREEGVMLDALTREGKRVDGERVVAEAAREFLEAIFDAQDVDDEGGVLAALRGFRDADEAFTHVWLSCAEALCEANPAFLLLAGGEEEYLELLKRALEEALKNWRSRAARILLDKRFGESFILDGKITVSREKLGDVGSVLVEVASGLEEGLRKNFPLVALTFEVAGRGLLEELADYVFSLVQHIQENVFSNFKTKVLEELNVERIRLLYHGLTFEEIKAKVEEYVYDRMREFEEQLYFISNLLVLSSPVLERAGRELRDNVLEKVVSTVMKGEVPVLLTAIKHVKSAVKDLRGRIFLDVAEAFLKEAGGGVMAALPALGYMLEEAGMLDAFTGKVKATCEEMKAPLDVEGITARLMERGAFLSGCVEDIQIAGSAFMRGLKKSIASWIGRILLDEHGRPPVVRLLYNSYLDLGARVNGARLAFKVLSTIVSELRREGVFGARELAEAVEEVYETVVKELRRFKEEDKARKLLDKVSRKVGVSFSSVKQLSSYLAKRKSTVWGWVLGKGEGDVMLVPQVSLDPNYLAAFYTRISDVISEDVSLFREIVSLLKGAGVNVEEKVRDALNLLAGEARKLKGMRGVKRRVEELLKEKSVGIFRRPEPFEEIVERWRVDPFFGGREEFLEGYVSCTFWEDKDLVTLLVDRAIKRLTGLKDESELVNKVADSFKRQKETFKLAFKVLSEHFSQFTQYLELQSILVELSFLSNSEVKFLKKLGYPDLKMELKTVEEKAVRVEVEEGKPFVVLGEVDGSFFPRGGEDVKECLKNFGEFKVKSGDSKLTVLFELPGFGGEVANVAEVARASAWETFMKENEEYFKVFREVLGPVGPGAQQELDMLKEFLKFNVFKAK
ncbi:MAG: hypothetical protein QW461_00365 [Candidatus Jordarchaeales archaeon]